MNTTILYTLVGLLYIFLLTNIFEYFINRPSSTMLTVCGVALIAAMTVALVAYIIKTFKNR